MWCVVVLFCVAGRAPRDPIRQAKQTAARNIYNVCCVLLLLVCLADRVARRATRTEKIQDTRNRKGRTRKKSHSGVSGASIKATSFIYLFV